MAQFGLTSTGFRAKQQQEIKAEIQTALQSAFGQAINLLPESVFGQIVGIISEREALLWQLAEAVFSSQAPASAEGTAVDNILALNNLRRLSAAPSTVSLTLFGTAATLIPKFSQVSVLGSPTSIFQTDADATIAAAVNEIQTLAFTSVPTKGQFTMSIVDPAGNTLTTTPIGFCSPANVNSVLRADVNPTSGQFKITVGGQTTAFIPFAPTSLQIQNAIQALTGYGSVTVSGTTFTGGFVITWTGVAASVNRIASLTSNTLNQTVIAGNNVQDIIRALIDVPAGNTTPYSDVTVTGNYTTGFVITFAGIVSGGRPQNSFVVAVNTLFNGAVAVNITVIESQKGAFAQAVVTATCTVNGPVFAPAGTLTVIGTPISGWTSVNNPLDAIVGRNLEDDTDAMIRRTSRLATNANAPLQSIVEKVSELIGVTSVVGFENLSINTDYSVIRVTFPPSNTLNPLISGHFKLQFGGVTGPITAFIQYNDTAPTIQGLIQALGAPYNTMTVSGDFGNGFVFFFGSALAGQPVPLVSSNTLQTSTQLVTVSFIGRPGKAFEIVVEGGTDADIALTIWGSKPAGIQAYGTTGPIIETDQFGQTYPIYFSRPFDLPIYLAVTLSVKLATFPLDGVQQIQEALVGIGDAIGIGQEVILFGSNGLIGAFNSVPGIEDYDLFAGIAPNPVLQNNIVVQPQQLAEFDTSRIVVTVNYV